MANVGLGLLVVDVAHGHDPEGAGRPGQRLHDVLTCIRHHATLPQALGAGLLHPNSERFLKSPQAMAALFDSLDRGLPQALRNTLHIAERCDVSLDFSAQRLPAFPVPEGYTAGSYLRCLCEEGLGRRFDPVALRARVQMDHELAVIEGMGLAGYFLVVWDIVRFARQQGIRCQGRGSAANSAVCYALSITAVDPVKMELLFERFLSEERGEWPDIDLDLPSGDQREKVIQYVYQRYGPHGAAMTANVITYRDRSAAREVAKALGYSAEQVDKLAKRLGHWTYDTSRGDSKTMAGELPGENIHPWTKLSPRVRGIWRLIIAITVSAFSTAVLVASTPTPYEQKPCSSGGEMWIMATSTRKRPRVIRPGTSWRWIGTKSARPSLTASRTLPPVNMARCRKWPSIPGSA